MEIEHAIQIKNLSKNFGNHTVIENLNLNIEAGKITAILAPSGAGKTTLLRLIAGLDKPTSGKIFVDGKEVVEIPRNLGFMFQENSVFGWLSVRKNIEFGLNLTVNKKQTIYENKWTLVENIAELVGISNFLDYFPSQLSGGQKQRVVIARSLILNPKIIICDEPFSALDEKSREELRQLVLNIQREFGNTVVFITHNTEEADFLGDYVLLCSTLPMSVFKIKNRI